MSEGKKRTVHSAEFKAKVGMEAVRGVKALNEIGQQYGVHPVVVGQWKKELVERAARCSTASAGQSQRRTPTKSACTGRSGG